VKFETPNACGWSRTEPGVRGLVRKSSLDYGSRWHTLFAAVFVSPEIPDDLEIGIDGTCAVFAMRIAAGRTDLVTRPG